MGIFFPEGEYGNQNLHGYFGVDFSVFMDKYSE